MRFLRQIVAFIIVVIIVFLIMSCKNKDSAKIVDYSQYAFTDTLWTRKAEHDIETIWFGSDGSYYYSCACGNPVNDSDLNEGYIYDDKTKTVTVRHFETTEETVSKIKIDMCDKEKMILDFDGEKREFVIGLS